MEMDLEKLRDETRGDPGLGLPGAARFALPLMLAYPEQGSVLFETPNSRREDMIGALNNVILRLLSVAPPGRFNFTDMGPAGARRNFAGAMHLPASEAQIINKRPSTQSGQ